MALGCLIYCSMIIRVYIAWVLFQTFAILFSCLVVKLFDDYLVYYSAKEDNFEFIKLTPGLYYGTQRKEKKRSSLLAQA